MTEAEWDTCTEPQTMLAWVRWRAKLTDRKARLFAVACCRRIWPLLSDERSRRAVEAAEAFADDCSLGQELAATYYAANVACLATSPIDKCYVYAASLACSVAYHLPLHGCFYTGAAVEAAADAAADPATDPVPHRSARKVELAFQCQLLRDLFGDPSRPVAVAGAWRTPEVVAFAHRAYDRRDFTLLPDLARLLEAAGCNDAELLAHLTRPGPHAGRGCWALDLLLQKE